MSPNDHQRAVCARKRRYESKAAADTAALARWSPTSGPLGSYKCPECEGWHLTKRSAVAIGTPRKLMPRHRAPHSS